MKGCELWFCPQCAQQRYCSEECWWAARRCSRWNAQQSYRAAAAGKEKRNEQGQRYRERVRKRQQPVAARSREGNDQRVLSVTVATGLAAMEDSRTWGESPLRRFLFHARASRHGTCLATGAVLAVGATVG